MAHVGRKWPYAKFRDLWINNEPPWGIHRNWRWRGNLGMGGTLGGGWGLHRISQDGVPDYDLGLLRWTWLPPPSANPHTRYHLEMFLLHDPPFVRDRFRVWVSYDEHVSPKFSFFITNYANDRFFSAVGNPGLTVPGVGTLQGLVNEIEGMRWIDYPAEQP